MSNAPRMSLRDKLAAEINGLVSEGKELLQHVRNQDPAEFLPFAARYHTWYTRALVVVKALVPDRLDEFRRQHEREAKRKGVDRLSYVLEDYLNGLSAPTTYDYESREYVPSFSVKTAVFLKLNTQVEIIASCASRLNDILANIRGVLQADLFDSQLDAAREFKKNGHLRAAGALAGVALEGHLAQVCASRTIVVRKRDPTISDFNDALKNENVLDVPQWRWIQRLGDVRNLCSHKKGREPTADEVDELIEGVDKAIKTLA